MSANSEFSILNHVSKSGFSIRLTEDKGHDFFLNKIPAEIKDRILMWYQLKKFMDSPPQVITPEVLTNRLMRAWSATERGFLKQSAKIVITDVTGTLEGSAIAIGRIKKSETLFKETIANALEFIKQGDLTWILFENSIPDNAEPVSIVVPLPADRAALGRMFLQRLRSVLEASTVPVRLMPLKHDIAISNE